MSSLRHGRIDVAVILAVLLILLLAVVAWIAFGKKGTRLPQNASVVTEGFGTPVTLGMNFEDAQKSHLPKESAVELVCLTPEDLAGHDLYKEHSMERDLVAAIGTDLGGGMTVQGLRAYLGKVEAEGDRATLGGQFAANLGIEEVKQMYGKPFSETPEQNGRTHLVYYFADPEDPRLSYRLTTSHDYTGKIFSMALEQVLAPQ